MKVRTLVHCCAMFVSAFGASMALADTLTPTTDISAATYSTVDWNSKSIRIYKDLAYGTRADQADEGANYVNKAGGKNSYHTHRSGQQYDLYLPASPISDAPVYLDVHGGSWSECFDKDGSEVEVMKSLAARGFVAIGMDYQLQSDIMSKGVTTARENATFADMLRDIDAMLQYLKDNEILQSLGASTNKIIIGGTSAGAHLSMMYAWDQAATNHSVALNHPLPIRAVVPVQGPSDFTDPSMMVMAAYFPYLENKDYVAASPELQQMKAYVTLMGWLSNTTLTQENFATEMAKWSPALLINENSCPAILAYSTTNTVDDASAHQSSDGMVPVPLYDSLTNKLTAAGVDYRASLFTGISHGYLAWSENLESNAGYQWLVPEIANYATNFVESASGGTGGESGGEEEDPPTGSIAKKVTLTLSADLATTEITTGLPTLVRLSESSIAGFLYSDFRLANGGDLKFTDAAGIEIPHEVDTWDPSGESLVWVRLPSTAAGTKITMYWGGGEKGALASSAVWSDYIGVWHLGDAVGVSANSTAAGAALNGVDTTRTIACGSVEGRFGNAKVVSDHKDKTGAQESKNYGGIYVPHSDALQIAGKFTISGWFKHANGKFNWDHVFYKRKKANNEESPNGAFAIEMSQGNNSTSKQIGARGNGGNVGTVTYTSDLTQWSYLTFVFNDNYCAFYQNGVKVDNSVSITAATANTAPLIFGNNTSIAQDSSGDAAWYGSIDEVRLVGSSMTADQVALEYKAMTAASFEPGRVEPQDQTAVRIDAITGNVSDNGTATITIPVLSGEGTVSVVYNESVTNEVRTVNGADTLTVNPAIPEGAIWSVSAYAINAKGTETASPNTIGVMNGVVNATKINDTDEETLADMVFRLSRPASATAYPLTVNLAWGGTAVAGVNFAADLPATAVIPAGAETVDIAVTPLLDGSGTDDVTVTLTVAPGPYIVGTAATGTIANLELPEGFLVWIAPEAGKASVASNWSLGRVPNSSDNILFDGRFSKADCEWDADAVGTVASWTMKEGYTGKITIDTKYVGDFTQLNVTGNVDVQTGTLTHPANGENQEYRLKLIVGGDFTMAEGTKINLQAKGFAGGKCATGGYPGIHGGAVGMDSSAWGYVRGDVREPAEIGAGGADNYAGGGALWLEVAGAAVINGEINVRGADNSALQNIASAAPGSIYVKAGTVTGEKGVMNASAYACNQANKRGASGGRIAVVVTNSDVFGMNETNLTARGSVGTVAGAAGTILIKTTAHGHFGRLIIDNVKKAQSYVSRYCSLYGTTPVLPGQTWEIDEIHFRGYGMLSIPEGATLALQGPLTKITGEKDSAIYHGIVYMGGTFTFDNADPNTFSNYWRFQPNSPYTINGNVAVSSGSIGCFDVTAGYSFGAADAVYPKCDLTVTGNLRLAHDGYGISVTQGGGNPFDKANFSSGGLYPRAAHGGLATNLVPTVAYDSVFNPCLPGMAADDSSDTACSVAGGGVLKLNVGGLLKIEDRVGIHASGVKSKNKSSAGGAVDITCDTIQMSTNGYIYADSVTGYEWNTSTTGCPGGAGRVALRIKTANPDLPSQCIRAKGITKTKGRDSANSTEYASAGTVYIENGTAESDCGTIYVRNDDRNYNPLYTPIPSTRLGGENEEWKTKTLVVSNGANIAVADTVRLSSLNMAAGSKLNVYGNRMYAKHAVLGGVKLPNGMYFAKAGSANETYSQIVNTGAKDGVLVVGGVGFFIHIR